MKKIEKEEKVCANCFWRLWANMEDDYLTCNIDLHPVEEDDAACDEYLGEDEYMQEVYAKMADDISNEEEQLSHDT